jgi:predicted DNA-binding transcriptional regulator AlpA
MLTETTTPPADGKGGKPTLPPLLVDAGAAAKLCGVSKATWYRLMSAGKVPAPIRLGGRVLWRVRELELWTEHGCPDRAEWLRIKAEAERRRGHLD